MFFDQLFGLSGNTDNQKENDEGGGNFNKKENNGINLRNKKIGGLQRSSAEGESSDIDLYASSVVAENLTGNHPRRTIRVGMYSIDSSYEISLLALVMMDKLFKKYSSQCLYICHKPFSLLKRSFFGCTSAYSDKEDIRKLAKFLFYMDDEPFTEKSHLIDKVHNLDYIFTYGTDKLLGNPNYSGISKFVRWIEESDKYNYIFCDVGDNLDMESIELLKECEVIVRGSRKFPGSVDTLDMDKNRTIDVIFDENTESELGFYASDIDKVDMLRDGQFSYTFQLNNDLEFLIDRLIYSGRDEHNSIDKHKSFKKLN